MLRTNFQWGHRCEYVEQPLVALDPEASRHQPAAGDGASAGGVVEGHGDERMVKKGVIVVGKCVLGRLCFDRFASCFVYVGRGAHLVGIGFFLVLFVLFLGIVF